MKYQLDSSGYFVSDAADTEELAFWTDVPMPQPIGKPRFVNGAWIDEDPLEVPDESSLLANARLAAFARNNKAYDDANAAITAGYPQSEKDTWPTQDREIKLYVADPDNALTPWIDTAAAHRGITRELYIEKTLVKIAQFEQVSAYLTGRRQGFEDQVKASSDTAAINAMQFTYPLG